MKIGIDLGGSHVAIGIIDNKNFIVETLRNKSRIFTSKFRPIYQIFLTNQNM